MQPRPESTDFTRGLAWMVTCDAGLTVTLAVVGRHVLLRADSREKGATAWRVGTYVSDSEAALRAVDMTSSYEKTRHGTVGKYAEVRLPSWEWTDSVDGGEIKPGIADKIDRALSTAVSPVLD